MRPHTGEVSHWFGTAFRVYVVTNRVHRYFLPYTYGLCWYEACS